MSLDNESVIVGRAPLRADLAGGTLDLWPLGCFHPGSRTVNVALDGFAECELRRGDGPGFRFESEDYSSELEFARLAEAEEEPRTALFARIARRFAAPAGLVVRTRSASPPGSGLGGSSALSVATFRAFAELAASPLPEASRTVAILRDLEASLLGKPAGIQDFYPPLQGGLLSIRHEPGGEVVGRPLPGVGPLRQRIALFHTGKSHFSAENNWEIFRRRCEGDSRIARLFDAIRDAAADCEAALGERDWSGFARAVDAEWGARRQLADGIVTEGMARAEAAGRRAGARAAKTCGAGGGGALLFVLEPGAMEAVRPVVAAAVPEGNWLDLAPTDEGASASLRTAR